MPINIYTEKNNSEITYLCDNVWDLSIQIYELEKWLENKGKKLPKGNYVADIGFSIRNEATGGGSVINTKIIKIMSEIGMEIYLSEYPTK